MSLQVKPIANEASVVKGPVDRLLAPGVFFWALLLLTFVTYLPTIAFDFVWDDRLVISLNPWLAAWSDVPKFFTHQVWAFDPFQVGGNYYRPLFLLWLFVIQHATDGAPGWFHLATVGLHLSVVAEVYVLARLLTRREDVAAIAALIFALHPAKVESVAWISGLTDPLCALFTFAALICWLHWDGTHGLGWKFGALAAFAMALLAKESAILVPVSLGVYEWYGVEGAFTLRAKWLARRLWAFGPVLAGYLIARSYALHGLSQASLTGGGRATLLSVPLATWWYIRHLLWPVDLSALYGPITVTRWSLLRVGLPAAALLAAGVVLWWRAARSRATAMLFWWFPLTLAPALVAISIVQMHDRYLYLPSFSFAIGAGWLIAGREKVAADAVKPYSAWFTVAIAALLVVGTIRESRFWDNDIALFEHAVQTAPAYVPARWYLAGAYRDVGREEDAHRLLLQTTSAFPHELRAWELLGRFEYEHGNFDAAQAAFTRVLAIPTDDRARDFSFYNLGLIAQSRGDLPSAADWYRRALDANPESRGARQSLEAVEGLRRSQHVTGDTPIIVPAGSR